MGIGVRVCPACGELAPPAGAGAPPVEFCLADGFALVKASDFEGSGRDLMLGRTIARRFTVIARLGTGSMGAVYRAWQGAVGRWVALKIMRYDRVSDVEARARFEREARAMSQLVSPHTATIYDFGQAQDGSVFLAMELLEGESLGTRLARCGRLSISESVRIGRDALASLAEAHAKGIIHRDLKPDNLFLTEVPPVAGVPTREICKLLDFGIAKVIREEQPLDALETQAGTVFGTPRYMSPEQAQGKRLDARSDIYALGVILYQMVTGRVPFDDEDAVVVMARHIKTPPRPPRDVAPDAQIPPQLERVIMRSLSKEAGDRPDSASTMILALDAAERAYSAASSSGRPAIHSGDMAVVQGDPLASLPPSAVRRRRRQLTALLAMLGVAAVVGGVAIGRAKPEASWPASSEAVPSTSLLDSPALAASVLDTVSEGLSGDSELPAATASKHTVVADSLPIPATATGGPSSERRPSPARGRMDPPATVSSPSSAAPPAATSASLRIAPSARVSVALSAAPPLASTAAPPAPPPAATGRYERFE